MSADIHTCSYSCQRPACVLAQRDELAKRADQDAAEIVRLRGEVALAAGWHDEAIAPAEANGNWDCPHSALDGCDCYTPQPAGGEAVAAVMWLRMKPDGTPDWAEDCCAEDKGFLDPELEREGYWLKPLYDGPAQSGEEVAWRFRYKNSTHWQYSSYQVGNDPPFDFYAAIEPLYTTPPAAQVQPRPSDDHLWDQTLQQRDRYHEVADDLAALIASITGMDIGEHSSANFPWENAKEAAEDYIADRATKAAQVQQEAVAGHLRACPFCGCAITVNNAGLGVHPRFSDCIFAQQVIVADDAAQVEKWNRRATHPADALGAVRELVEKLDAVMIDGTMGEGYDSKPCKHMVASIASIIVMMRAALQHRGDSQEVGRG